MAELGSTSGDQSRPRLGLIPVFASVPSKLEPRQAASQRFIYSRLEELRLTPRTVGGSDSAIYNPLHEVRSLARHCSGGIILGYRQLWARQITGLIEKFDEKGNRSVTSKPVRGVYSAPTPWNQLETGILFGLGLPLFVLKEEGISGGIFDEGASDVLVHKMPMPSNSYEDDNGVNLGNIAAEESFHEALLRWQGLVRAKYYNEYERR